MTKLQEVFLKCPFCQSDNLEPINEDGKITQCCDDCGGSFEVVQEPQDILLENIKSQEPYEKMRG